MEKGEGRAHQRRRKAAENARRENKKSKRSSKKEGDIMRTEVRRYKEAEKNLKVDEGTAMSSTRMTIQQGIYGHGRTSGAVCRGIGMNEETKARAEANLTRILALASHQQSFHHVSDPLTASQEVPHHSSNTANATTVSPCRFFLPRKSHGKSSTESDESHPKKQQADSMSNIIISSSDKEKSRPLKKKSHKTSNEKKVESSPSCDHVGEPSKSRNYELRDTRNTEQNTKTCPSKSKLKNKSNKPGTSPTLQARKSTSGLPSRESVVSPNSDSHKQVTAAKSKMNHPTVELDSFASTAAAVKATLTSKSALFEIQMEDMLRENLHILAQAHKESKCVSSAGSIDVITNTCNTGLDRDDKRQDQCKEKNDNNIFETPSSLDYLRHMEDRKKVKSTLNTTICPGTTIISPKALLLKYEDKLHKAVNSRGLTKRPGRSGNLHCKQLTVPKSNVNSMNGDKIFGASSLLKEPNDYFQSERKILTGKKLENLDRSERSKCLKKLSNQVLSPQPSDYICQSECPKTVVVDPLHYLERYEKQVSTSKESKTTQKYNALDEHAVVSQSIFDPSCRSDKSLKEECAVENLAPVTNSHQCYEVKTEQDNESIRRSIRPRKRSREWGTNCIKSFPKNSLYSTTTKNSCLPSHCQVNQCSSSLSGYRSNLPPQEYIPQGELINPCNNSLTRHVSDKSIYMINPTAGEAKPLLQLGNMMFTSNNNHSPHKPEDSPVLHEMQPVKCTDIFGYATSRNPLVITNAPVSSRHMVHDAARMIFPNDKENKKSQQHLYVQPSFQPWPRYHEGQVQHPFEHNQVKSKISFESESDWNTGQHHYYPEHYQHQGPHYSSSSYSYCSGGKRPHRAKFSYNEGNPDHHSIHQTYKTCPHHSESGGGDDGGTIDWVERDTMGDFSFLRALDQ